ncbi:MAG: nucleotidyltransferase family protein [Deltaproteobacteria bacterium]|jgi:molybdenum cofactor cytidylyltransferase|nr:nucleotidyltransferase family protein [Deltaproteobacteria bacterium]
MMQGDAFGRKVAGILLAAGASTRMGSLKQLMSVAGMTLVERSLTAALESRLDRLVLVLGHRAREIERALGAVSRDPRLTIVHNRYYREGISSSLVAGVEEIAPSHDHGMILLADMPFIDRRVIDLLIENYLNSRLPIGAVKVSEGAAHPVVFRRDLFLELKALTGDVGARLLLKKYSDQVCLIAPGRDYDNRDIDTQQDYRNFQTDLKERKKQWPIS